MRIPHFAADGFEALPSPNTTRLLTFSTGAPPSDGSLDLCIISLATFFTNSSSGLNTAFTGGGGSYRRLAYFDGGMSNSSISSDDGHAYELPLGWHTVSGDS